MTEATKNYALILPNFDVTTWHTEVNGNFISIDSLLFNAIGLSNVVGTWTNATNYTAGQRVFDPDDATLWNCLVDHSSAPIGTFAEDRLLNPSYWNTVGSLPFIRGQWMNDTVYAPGDFAYDTVQSLVGVANVLHTSGSVPTTMRDEIALWDIIADLSSVTVLVSSVNGQIGDVVLDADDIDDTSTIQKFVEASQITQITDHETRLDLIEPVLADHASRISALEMGGAGVTKASIWQTGMIAPWTSIIPPTTTNDNGVTPAWLLCNGGTIGNVGSGGSLRANADMSALFSHLWNNFANSELVIQTSGGVPTTRGANAGADFTANKRLPVPDCRGGVFYFSDIGKGAITVTGHSTPGYRLGKQNLVLTFAHLPANIPNDVTSLVFTGQAMGSHGHDVPAPGSRPTINEGPVTPGHNDGWFGNPNLSIAFRSMNTSSVSAGTPKGDITGSVTVNPSGGTLATPTLSPGIVMPSAIIKT